MDMGDEMAQLESKSSDVEDNEENSTNSTAPADICSNESDAEDDDYGSTDRESNFDKNEYIDVLNETASDPKRRKLSKVQQVSFHKIANGNDLLGLTSEAIIEKIINKYNKNSNAKYLREMPTKIHKVNEHSEDEQFKIMIYIQKLEGSSRLLENYGISFVQKTFNAVIFHYKTDCVYAVTKGSGWRLIQSYVDYEFPQKVAVRILSEEGRISFVDKQLLGNARSINTTLKKDEPTDPFALAVLCTKFTARLRPNASILKFDCFKDISNSFKQAKQTADVKVEIGFGSVRFKREFEVEDFFLILEHLNKIDRGDKTLTTDGQEENPSNAFYRYLQKVPPLKEDELNLYLVKKIQDDVQNHKLNICLKHFDLCHKYTAEFTHGSEYTLYYNKNFVKKFSKAPSFESILMNLRTEEKCKSLRKKNCSTENFRKKLGNVRISFKQMNEGIISAKLLDYIEGNIFFDDQFYWRVMTKWCCVSEDYLKLVQKEFVDLLNKHLMDEEEIGYLWKPWNHKVSEKVYNKSYSTENGFIVGDRKTVKQIELFDLMFHDQESNSTFLYHVKKNFNQSTRVACSQVMNCAKVIGWIMQGKSAKPDIIEEFYEEYMKNQKKEELPNFMSTCDKFKKALEKPTLVYAVAPNAKLGPKACQLSIEHMFSNLNEREESRSLHLEKKLKENIFAIDIATQLKKIGEKHYKEIANILCETNEDDQGKVSYILGVKIVDELKQENYIDSNGEVTSKLLYCSKRNFKLPSFKEKFSLNEVIYKILSPYLSFFDSLGAKLEVLRTRNELAKLGFDGNHFKICEITSIE